MTAPIDRAVSGAAQAPLTKSQRSRMMARYIIPAWAHRTRQGLTAEALEPWRREEQFKACHKESLRSCVQADWNLLASHFLGILGRREAAQAAAARAGCDGLAVARRKLREAMDAAPELGNARAYAAAICARQYGCDLSDASERQCWSLVFTLRSRAAKKRGTARV